PIVRSSTRSTSSAQADGQSCGQTERTVRSARGLFMGVRIAAAKGGDKLVVVIGGIPMGNGHANAPPGSPSVEERSGTRGGGASEYLFSETTSPRGAGILERGATTPFRAWGTGLTAPRRT